MSVRIRVASYNVGNYSGIGIEPGSEKSREEFQKVLKKTGADLWALQEDVEFFNDNTKESAFDAIYKHVLPNYWRNFTCEYNGKAFLTRFDVTDVEVIPYTDNWYSHRWFYKGKICLDNKEITIISLHLDWNDNNKRAQQITQIIDYAKTREYCIIMGDFNPNDYIDSKKQSEKSLFREEYARFTDAGFELANAGKFGIFDTIVDPERVFEDYRPIDNIIVSPNIKIVSADRCCEPWMNDHAVIIAELEIL